MSPSAPRDPRHVFAFGLAQIALAIAVVLMADGCARAGRLKYVEQTVAPVKSDSAGITKSVTRRAGETRSDRAVEMAPVGPLFGDTLIGLVPGTGDSSRRYLGRLRQGYTADTVNIMMFGDNRPGIRSTRLGPEVGRIRQALSPNPIKIVKGLIAIPTALVKGLVPDLALIRDIPAFVTGSPTYGREHQVLSAMLSKIDSLNAHQQTVSAVINTGDMVVDGRIPAHWERFLRITRPLSSRVPYFAVAGNHERTDTEDGVENWRTATGLPVGGDRLYYCFDTADGWVRFIALDSNPIVDPKGRWTREVQIKYSQEQFSWLVERVKEHAGPVIIMMHHPPFSSGFHRMEWQSDAVMRERRERMMKALHETGISIIAAGHEHAYERALFTWPDAVMIVVNMGGAGAPLHDIPPLAQTAQLFTEYKVAGSEVKAENVFSAKVFHFVHLRLWFGGGEMVTYAVDAKATPTEIDRVKVDLTRYGVPKVDQHKIPVVAAKGPEDREKEMNPKTAKDTGADSTAAAKRILTKPPPGKKTTTSKATTRKSRSR
jgi:hypothetical protein